MSIERNNSLNFGLNPFDALENQQKQDLDESKPSSGQEIEVLNTKYFVASRGSFEGTDVYVIGEVVEEDSLPGYFGPLLREPEVPENYVAHELGIEVQDQSVSYAEFNTDNENVVEYDGDKYLKLEGEC